MLPRRRRESGWGSRMGLYVIDLGREGGGGITALHGVLVLGTFATRHRLVPGGVFIVGRYLAVNPRGSPAHVCRPLAGLCRYGCTAG